MGLLLSCSDPTAPENLIEEQTYIDIFTELVIINQLNEQQLDSLSQDSLRTRVLEEYRVTDQQFEEAHRYYQKQPDAQLKRLDIIEEKLDGQRELFQQRLNDDREKLINEALAEDSLAADSLSVDTVSADTLLIEQAMPDFLDSEPTDINRESEF